VVNQKKMKKTEGDYLLELERTRDILGELGKRKGNRILVGFAAETDNLIANAQKKLSEKNIDLVVANDITKPGAGFGVDTNQVQILYPSGEMKDLPVMSKEELSGIILDGVLELLNQKKTGK
jgi:phosphopantothenoylcysteine decarboxylase/phosphopantothenate--cysteine ligase